MEASNPNVKQKVSNQPHRIVQSGANGEEVARQGEGEAVKEAQTNDDAKKSRIELLKQKYLKKGGASKEAKNASS